MKYDPISRRLFLQGLSGAALAIPFIPSLVPVEAHAATNDVPLRYVHLVHWNGARSTDFFPSDAGVKRVADGVYAQRLESIGPTISAGENIGKTGKRAANIGAGFDPFRNRMTVIRGLDLQVQESVTLLHGKWTTSTASHDADGTFGWSIDMVLENSKKFYATTPSVRGLRMGAGERTSIWNGKDQPFTFDPRQVFEQAFGVCNGASADSPAEVAAARRRTLLVDQVFQDFKTHRDSRFISSEGRAKLDDWMSLVSDLESTINATFEQSTLVTCGDVPAAGSTVPNGTLHELYNKITVAALASGNTRIVTQRLNGHADSSLGFDHSGVHAHTANWRLEKEYQYNTHFLNLLKQMDAIKEANGKSLLDNSIVFNVGNMGDPNHRINDLPVVLVGGANGKLRMGEFIDYRQRTGDVSNPQLVKAGRGGFIGRPYNEFLISLFNAFGLAAADYEQNGQTGFGSYKSADRYGQFYNNKRSPLPYLYTG